MLSSSVGLHAAQTLKPKLQVQSQRGGRCSPGWRDQKSRLPDCSFLSKRKQEAVKQREDGNTQQDERMMKVEGKVAVGATTRCVHAFTHTRVISSSLLSSHTHTHTLLPGVFTCLLSQCQSLGEETKRHREDYFLERSVRQSSHTYSCDNDTGIGRRSLAGGISLQTRQAVMPGLHGGMQITVVVQHVTVTTPLKDSRRQTSFSLCSGAITH